MKRLFSILFISGLLSSLSLRAQSEDNSIQVVEELIRITEHNLQAQKKLLQTLIHFKNIRAAFIMDPTSRKSATELVKSARTLYKSIQDEHLSYLFTADFMTEIQFFNQVGNQQLPRG